MQECLEIARALGAHPEIEIERRIDGAERVGDHRTSTLQDLDAGKRLELDALIVAVVELADLTGTPAPTLRALSASSSLLAESLGLLTCVQTLPRCTLGPELRRLALSRTPFPTPQ